MPRQDVPYGGGICRLKERIAEIWDKLGDKLHSINGVEGDGAGDVKIVSGDAAVVINNDQIGHKIEVGLNHNAIPTASSLIAGNNIEINPAEEGKIEISVTDDVSVNNLSVNGNIIQQGTAYETHAEKIYTKDDFISMRDGAIGGLAAGSLSGLEVIKYDGINNARLAIDNKGVARIGDVGDEQPLLTREESEDLNEGEYLTWDSAHQKAIGVSPPVLNQTIKGWYTLPLNEGVTIDKNSIILARIISIPSDTNIYIRIDNSSSQDIRQYGSYAIAGQQIMIPAFANAGEKIRITDAPGASVYFYIISL